MRYILLLLIFSLFGCADVSQSNIYTIEVTYFNGDKDTMINAIDPHLTAEGSLYDNYSPAGGNYPIACGVRTFKVIK